MSPSYEKVYDSFLEGLDLYLKWVLFVPSTLSVGVPRQWQGRNPSFLGRHWPPHGRGSQQQLEGFLVWPLLCKSVGEGVCSFSAGSGLEARITLWASICWPSSEARVTSANSLSSLRLPNAMFKFSWKSSHLRRSFWDMAQFSTRFFHMNNWRSFLSAPTGALYVMMLYQISSSSHVFEILSILGKQTMSDPSEKCQSTNQKCDLNKYS